MPEHKSQPRNNGNPQPAANYLELPQVLIEEYKSFYAEFPPMYSDCRFRKDHLINAARFAIKLRSIDEENAPDSLELMLRDRIRKAAPGELSRYVDQAEIQALDYVQQIRDEVKENGDSAAQQNKYDPPNPPPDSLQQIIVEQLNKLLDENNLYEYFADKLQAAWRAVSGEDGPPSDQQLRSLKSDRLRYLNRLLIESAYPNDLRKANESLSGIYSEIHKKNHAALCMSGGGIRSASFALGVAQGLARYGVLNKFEYLSTVSGGGYFGSWLTAWIHRHPGGLPAVIEDLANRHPESTTDPEPETIRHLRAYSNFLSPKLGLLSADTWTLVATYLRNLLVNWLVLIPLIAAVLMIPRICIAVVRFPATQHELNSVGLWGSFLLGFAGAAWSTAYISLHRPSSGANTRQRSFIVKCLLPLFASAVCLTTHWAWFRSPAVEAGVTSLDHWVPRRLMVEADSIWGFIILGVIIHLSGLLIWLIGNLLAALRAGAKKGASNKDEHRRRNFILEVLLIIVVGTIGGCLLWVGAVKLFPSPEAHADLYVCFAAPLYLLIFLAIVILFAGLSSYWTNDEDREWWARFGAWLLIAAVAWSVISVLAIYGPVWLQWERWRELFVSLGGVSGVITLMLGRSAKTPANNKQKEKAGTAALLMNKAMALAGPIFAVFIIILLSLSTSILLWWLADKLPLPAFCLPGGVSNITNPAVDHMKIINETPVCYSVLVALLLFGVGSLMGLFVNTNKFSMHGMYRNRLIRAFLGASNDKRNPNLFTGFDEGDNIMMYELWPKTGARKPGDKKLLHVVNMALNLVAGDNLAWQQRKAESFTVTALHAGNRRLGYRRTFQKDLPEGKQHYGGNNGPRKGISLGTAVTISGAAASPNMGYHSSPVVTFLLSLFNVRLGWWLGNTGKTGDKTYHLPAPRTPLFSLVQETLGLTDDKRSYIYLSDGGHFDNLGLYEMVLRRCRYIIVSDAGQDVSFSFEDLGNAVRKIRVDLGIPIVLDKPVRFYARSEDRAQNKRGLYCAIGSIRYSHVDDVDEGHDGTLIYIKPAFYGREPRDVFQYAKSSPDFPHETTGDQFFSESQLESYRRLGAFIVDEMLGSWPEKERNNFAQTGDFELLLEQIRTQYLKRVRPRSWVGS